MALITFKPSWAGFFRFLAYFISLMFLVAGIISLSQIPDIYPVYNIISGVLLIVFGILLFFGSFECRPLLRTFSFMVTRRSRSVIMFFSGAMCFLFVSFNSRLPGIIMGSIVTLWKTKKRMEPIINYSKHSSIK
ncbi:MAG: hypothetical protein EZS28_016722 [Streblomastix strix]|uniref:Uncharacterized protein n=2 Tax=Streblomastix strix TaxID=222440 RepID=A0A5J4VYL6_9EUKA|nr:MAG: hypothetical protein EZS28_016722 [Streblomastix strix]